ncbi:MAG: adenosine deaminase [Burkholderiales bacterium]|nr:adenosine deaminase [Burkholderiales bacterium]
MKKIISTFFLISFALLTHSATADTAQQNRQATSNYYTKLVKQQRLSELTMLMTMLPKGGDIHHHYTGAIYAEHYLDWVAQQGYCIYRENDAQQKQEKFRIETRPQFINDTNKSCIKVDAVRQDNTFYRALLATWSMLDYEHHLTAPVAPDQHFFNTFGYFAPISKFNTNQGLKLLKERAKAENQQYLETMLKGAPSTDHPQFSATIDALPQDASVASMHAAFKEFADFLAQDASAQKKIADYMEEISKDVAGIDDNDFQIKVQTYVSRNSAPSKVFSSLFAAFSASQDHPIIVGVNILKAENDVVALRDYALHMQMFAYLKQHFPRVRLAMHAGELTLGLVSPEQLQNHIHSAVTIAGAARIGHGVDIMHEAKADQLLATMKERNIAVEINLSSNDIILGVKGQAHPILVYMRSGVPIVISSDDMGVSRNNLSHEYFLFASRYHPPYDTLKKTVYNSIRYSFLSEQDKTKQQRQLDQRFLEFEAATAKIAKGEVRKF